MSYRYIDTQEGFDAFIKERADAQVKEVAVDLEADSLHNYGESLCLIQYADHEVSAIIDPLAFEDISAIKEFVESRVLWMHGSDYDMSLFRRNLDWMPMNTLDSQVAARLLGVKKFGLANLLEQFLGLEVSKSNQKEDWSKRPLPQDMIDYALTDVNHLIELAHLLVDQLKEKNRYEWFVESCLWQQEKIAERPCVKEDPWRINGAGKLKRKGLHFLKYIWEWRDQVAEKLNRPSFKVVGNKPMLEWAKILQDGRELELPKYVRSWQREQLLASLEMAKAMPASSYPNLEKKIRIRKAPGAEELVKSLLDSRDKVAESLEVESMILGSRAAYEAIVYKGEALEEHFMRWQIDLLDFKPLFEFRNA